MEKWKMAIMAKCIVCGVELTDDNWWPSYRKECNYICIACQKQRHKQYRKTHKKEIKQYMEQYYKNHKEEIGQQHKQYDRLKKYGITIQQELNMLEAQGNKCAICDKPLNSLTEAHIDHNHRTGKVRGILCGNCNRAIGLLRDNPSNTLRATMYLLGNK